MSKHTLDEVLKDMLKLECLLPIIDYYSFNNYKYNFLYSEIFPNKLNSNLGLHIFNKRANLILNHGHSKFDLYYPILLFTKYKNKIFNSLQYKKTKSILLNKKVKIKEDNLTF